MESKIYSISEVAKILNITTQAVYKKIDKFDHDLEDCLTRKNNILHINKKGLDVLKGNSNKDPENNYDFETDLNSVTNKITNLVDNLVTNQIDVLSTELKEKNKQIEDLNRIIENMQVLLKQSQQNQLLLSENLKQHQVLLEKKNEKKSIWKKLFKQDH
jgi:chromosome segregation ATPase